jgi:hypothetical protein
MALMGMDTAGGANCAKAFQSSSDQIKQITGTLTSAMSFQWEGADAQKVRGDYDANLSKGLVAIADALMSWSQVIQKNVQEQEAASNAS